ncbi:MAG: MotA/TolQ/ExbB proton channel family protein [Colwellia sp.]|uniref:MotA/TolQ/ExbB proton channel family protein n=1 Tax=Colwellia sp. TaxID=56799 RepID=UPI001DECFBA3|nr:MotA/TolQ/ExbB proton channel family protein [Colwellia sp.]MCJ8297142.1 MotA/TolQ/ExbB proton channel family protein [Colwellia sp.]NQY50744.1 MotA/TolQ/ExbB proton channel family protein [Colwellia sp.]
MEIVKLFQAGGTFMYPILIVLAIGLVIAVERFIYLIRTEKATNSVWTELVPMLKALDFQRAVKLTAEIKTPIANVLNYGFARHNDNKSREVIEAALEEGIMDEMPQLTQRTHYLAMYANIATLLGLLGTIIGLIQAFTAVAQADPAEKADLLSASIAVAMNTTAFGLIAAIPLLLVHSYLVTKTAHLVDSIEKSALKALNLMVRD